MDRPDPMPLSLWIIETARSSALGARGHTEPAARAAERARLLAGLCASAGFKIRPDFANAHARWMGEVAGGQEETGIWGWFFLQRLGSFVDAHAVYFLDPAPYSRLRDLSAPDDEAVNEALASGNISASSLLGWPAGPEALLEADHILTRFGVIGDPHFGHGAAAKLLPAVVADLNRGDVAFSVAMGDITQAGSPAQYEEASRVLGDLSSAWMPTIGNHDLWSGAGAKRLFEEAFSFPGYGVHEAGGVRVILLDSGDPTPSPYPAFDLVAGTFNGDPEGSVAGGKIPGEVARWAQDLGPEGPTFIALHHPPYPYLGFPPLVFGLDEDSTQVLAETAARTGASAILCGHTHRCALTELAGIPVIEIPSAKEWPFGYGVVEVGEREWSFNLRQVSDAGIVEEAASSAGILFRRYAIGPDEARSGVWPHPAP